jgi:urease accessory protein
MKKLWSIALVAMLVVAHGQADAKRMGGGSSFGKQSGNVTQREASRAPAQNPQQAPAQNAAQQNRPATPATPAAAPKKPWGAMLGGAARLALPASFVLAMLLGGVAGHLGMPLPAIETGIALSVLALGLLVSLSVRMPTVLAMALTAGFAVFHGFAHGVEAPADGSFWLYGAGFAVATAALHAAGFTLNQHLTSTARRVLGAGVAATGGLLLSGML